LSHTVTPSLPLDSRTPLARRIALVEGVRQQGERANDDRTLHAMRLLDNMLWVLKGMTRVEWTKASPEDADIVVVHRGDEAARRGGWLARGKLIVEVLPPGIEPSSNSNGLVFPFRAADVMALLERLATILDSKTPTRDDVRALTPWRFLEELRRLREEGDADLWLVACEEGAPLLWMRGDLGTYKASAPTVQSLRRGTLRLSSLRLRRDTVAPADLEHRLGTDLCWHAGYEAADTLAPWLSATTKFRIMQWPNLGSIRPHPSLLRIVSALAATPSSLEELVGRTGASREVAARTLNALSATDSIVAVEQAPPLKPRAAASIAQPAGGFSKFLRSVRKHLGLGSDA
jgi:hypothetical protein